MYMCCLPFNVEQYPWSSMRWILFSWSPVPRTVHFWAVKQRKTDCASFTLASIISVFLDFLEQNCSWAANRWDINQWGFLWNNSQFSCSYQDWRRPPTHPAAFQQLVWEMMSRSVPTNPHIDSFWDCGLHPAARQLNQIVQRKWLGYDKAKCLHL